MGIDLYLPQARPISEWSRLIGLATHNSRGFSTRAIIWISLLTILMPVSVVSFEPGVAADTPGVPQSAGLDQRSAEQKPQSVDKNVTKVAAQVQPQGGTPQPEVSDTAAGHEIGLGETYEKQGRLADAEKAYTKALETATGADQQNARRHLQELFDKEDRVRTKYLAPSVEEATLGVWKSIVGTVETLLLLAALWLVAKVVRRLGERRGKNKVQIADFIDATGEGGGAAFAEQMRNAIEQVQEYYRARDRFRLGSFSALLVVSSPGPDDMVELAGELVSSPLGKFIAFFSSGFFRPRYKITGIVQKAGFHYSCRVKLFRRKEMFGSWERKFPADQCTELQEQLVFEVAMHLKEEVDANRD
jgi:hypothetical protein